MIEPPACKPQARVDILELEIGHLLDDLLGGEAVCQEIQNVAYPNPHATDAGTPSTLLRIYRDAIRQFGHDTTLSTGQSSLA